LPLSPPEPLADHQVKDFTSGELSLDDWLRRRARANQASGPSRTYVVCDKANVIGYHALASGAITVESVPGNPIPVVVLARLAVDRAYQGRGLGRALFRDVAYRVAHAADAIGIRGIVVNAISEDAREILSSAWFRSVRS
jgi:GNAT superfamily N-acetyltransferase